MKVNLQKILESKWVKRRKLAGLPVAEKLAMLDALRDRTRAIRDAADVQKTVVLRESPPEYKADPNKD
jgi:hypothetical protein